MEMGWKGREGMERRDGDDGGGGLRWSGRDGDGGADGMCQNER